MKGGETVIKIILIILCIVFIAGIAFFFFWDRNDSRVKPQEETSSVEMPAESYYTFAEA